MSEFHARDIAYYLAPPTDVVEAFERWVEAREEHQRRQFGYDIVEVVRAMKAAEDRVLA